MRISTDGGHYPEWSADGRELYHVSPDLKLMAVNLKAGGDATEASAPHELFALPTFANGYKPYDLASSGQNILVRALPAGQAPQPLTLLSNWPALLKQAPPQ